MLKKPLSIENFVECNLMLFDNLSCLATTYAGTHHYMSPEMKNNQIYSFKTDIW